MKCKIRKKLAQEVLNPRKKT